jgi:Arc/MetJ-type ribon-helix-helix transcriptional regulator
MDAVDFPANMDEELNILVKKGYYPSKSDLLRDAFRVLLNTRSELKISLAIELYLVGKISISASPQSNLRRLWRDGGLSGRLKASLLKKWTRNWKNLG